MTLGVQWTVFPVTNCRMPGVVERTSRVVASIVGNCETGGGFGGALPAGASDQRLVCVVTLLHVGGSAQAKAEDHFGICCACWSVTWGVEYACRFQPSGEGGGATIAPPITRCSVACGPLAAGVGCQAELGAPSPECCEPPAVGVGCQAGPGAPPPDCCALVRFPVYACIAGLLRVSSCVVHVVDEVVPHARSPGPKRRRMGTINLARGMWKGKSIPGSLLCLLPGRKVAATLHALSCRLRNWNMPQLPWELGHFFPPPKHCKFGSIS